jgi:hypothetical protein
MPWGDSRHNAVVGNRGHDVRAEVSIRKSWACRSHSALSLEGLLALAGELGSEAQNLRANVVVADISWQRRSEAWHLEDGLRACCDPVDDGSIRTVCTVPEMTVITLSAGVEIREKILSKDAQDWRANVAEIFTARAERGWAFGKIVL